MKGGCEQSHASGPIVSQKGGEKKGPIDNVVSGTKSLRCGLIVLFIARSSLH